MSPEIQTIVQDSNDLLSLVKPALEAQKKVASLEQHQEVLISKIAKLEQEKSARDLSIKTAAEKAADFFDKRGMLKIARESFVEQLYNSPEIIFDAVQRFADESTLKEAGVPGVNTPVESDLDPIQQFVLR